MGGEHRTLVGCWRRQGRAANAWAAAAAPRAAGLLGAVLQVTPGHVEADSVAVDVVERRRHWYVAAASLRMHAVFSPAGCRDQPPQPQCIAQPAAAGSTAASTTAAGLSAAAAVPRLMQARILNQIVTLPFPEPLFHPIEK